MSGPAGGAGEPGSRESLSTVEDLREYIAANGVSHVMVGVTDVDGVLCGKHVAADKLMSMVEKGGLFCEVVLGWDLDDNVIAAPALSPTFPDRPIVLDAASPRQVPGDRPTLLLLADFAEPLDRLCPRNVLKRVIARAEEMGFRPRAAFEYEFFLFEETPKSIRAKGFRDLEPMMPGSFGYSLLRAGVSQELYDDILSTCATLGVPLEGLHEESGPGVVEAAISVDDALEAADRAVLFKSFVKQLAQRRGLMATFMARWSLDWPGQGGHIHLSLQDAQGASAFHDPSGDGSMSEAMRQFVAGQQALLPEFLVLAAPTVNSYSRLTPGFWAPTSATWGIENRTCALRVVPGAPSAQRVEYRIAGADANPYLALAGALGSGLWGIEHGLEPTAPEAGDAYARTDLDPLPETLWESTQSWKGSSAARELFGSEFVDHFAYSREWEERQFRKAVTDWELERYFESI